VSATLRIGCPNECSLSPAKVGPGVANALLAIRQNGAGIQVMAKRAEELLKRPVPRSNMARHLHHYQEVDTTAPGAVDPSKKQGDLEILDLVIQRGAQNSQNWKPSIKDTLDAMKLKMQMTGNSAFDDLLALLDGPDIEEDEILPPESPVAIYGEAERPAEEEEDLPEVLI
jgi:hypothetical protein